MEFECIEIWYALKEHYYNSGWNIRSWRVFVKYQDLGIDCVDNDANNKYIVTNEKKWLMTKLKYAL